MFLFEDKSFVVAVIVVAAYVAWRWLYWAVTGGADEGVVQDESEEE